MRFTGILSRYIIKSFFKSFATVIVCFVFTIAILELMEVVRRCFSNSLHVPLMTLLKLTAHHTAISVFSFCPFTVFLASILFFTTMHWKLELTAMRTMGATTFDILKSLLIGAALLGAFYITVLDLISAHSINEVALLDTAIKAKFRQPQDNCLAVTNSGIWLRDVCDQKSYIINASSFDISQKTFSNFRLFEFNEHSELVQSVYSASAKILNGQWVLSKATIATASGQGETLDQMKIDTTVSVSKIDKMKANPAGISFWSMGKYIDALEHTGLSGAGYRIHWFVRLSSILQMFAFIILATAMCRNHNIRNSRRYAIKVAALVAVAFPIYFLNNVMVALGAHGRLPGQIATCIVPLFTMLTGILLLVRR
ncbi:MAG: LptF/LptG family permease [Holosporales bacterium]|jgi:LPS export ABC transporter permease LptG|nr:LptF/LptG family permease [Holosporales bacterium]